MEVNECIKSVLKKLDIAVKKKYSEVKDFRTSYDQNDDYTLALNVGTATNFLCTIRANERLIVIRSESFPEGLSSEEMDEIGSEIAERINAKMTAYDNKLVVMKAINFKKTEEESIEKLIFNEIMAFLQTLVLYQPKFNGEPERENGELNDDADEDPFGFNSLSLDSDNDDDGNDAQTPQQLNPQEINEESDQAGENQNEGTQTILPQDILTAWDEKESEESKRLYMMLRELEQEKPLDLPDVNVNSLVDVPALVDPSQGELPNDVDVLNTIDTYHGTDQYGLVKQTREYKTAAQNALDQIHELLSSLYTPIYRMSIELYGRSDQLSLNERNVQQIMDNLSVRQKKMDEMEAQILAQQEAILQDRANFNKYTDSVRGIIADYDIKCRTVNEQAEELRRIRDELSQKSGQVELLQRQLDAVTGKGTEGVSREYANALVKANEELQRQVSLLKARMDKYYEIINTFRECQQIWVKKEAEYNKIIRNINDNDSLSEKAKEEIRQAEARIAELEVAVATQQRLAEQQSALADEQRARADQAVTEEEKLRIKIIETEKINSELEQRAKTAETELANVQLENDVTHTASIIKEQLADIGVDVEPVPGEGEMILHADFYSCLIAIDVGLSIIYIKKAVKKPQKYSKLIDDLNTRDIMTSYSISVKDIACRSMFSKPEDVAVQIDKILSEMKQFK